MNLFSILKKQIATVLFSASLINTGFAQNEAFEYQKFKWEDKPEFNITEEDRKSDATLLKDYRVIEYSTIGKELKITELLYKVILINEDKAVEEFNKIYIPDYNTEFVIKFKARTIQPDGTTQLIDDNELKSLGNVEDKGDYKIVALQGVKKGCVIEYQLVRRLSVDYFGRQTYQSEYPVKEALFELATPLEYKFAAKLYNDTTPIIKDADGDKLIYKVELKNIPALFEEKYSNYTAYRKRVDYKLNEVVGNGAVLDWQRAVDFIVDGTYIFTSKEKSLAKSYLKKLDIDNKTELQKIRAIETAVKKDFQYQEESGDIYTDPEKIFKSKYANETGFRRLFALLFTEAEIKHELVVTSNRYNHVFDKEMANFDFLETFLFYFPSSKKYLIPDSYGDRLGDIPTSAYENDALFITPYASGSTFYGSYKIKQIPKTPMTDQGDFIDVTISFPETMEYAEINMTRTLKGNSSGGIQAIWDLLDEDTKKNIFDQFLKTTSEDAVILSKEIKNTGIENMYNNKPLIINGKVQESTLLEKAGKKYILNIGDIIGEQAEMYQDGPRQTDIDIDFPHRLDRVIKVNIPEGYQVKGLEGIIINKYQTADPKESKYGFESKYTLEGNVLTIFVYEYYDFIHASKDEIEAFKGVINASADFNKVKLVLEPK